jgi:asparaginyl-tRNA synthetase
MLNDIKFVQVSEILSGGYEDKDIYLRGWIYRTRSSGKIVFATVRDSSGTIQIIVERENVAPEHFQDAKKALVESSIILKGKVRADDRAPGGFEIGVSEIQVINFAEKFPITRDQSEEWLRENRHLWLRSKKLTSIMKIRSTVTGAIHNFFRDRGYYEFTPPILQPSACEGGATLFEVKYFEDVTYLSQSWQLYAEAAIFALEKVYDVAPTFRAEKSKTSRHLTEFWMAEMEVAWQGYREVTEIAKDEIKFILSEVLKHNRIDLELLGSDMSSFESMLEKPWPTITYTEALDILSKKSGIDIPWGKDLRTIEEDELMKHFETPVVVIQYPKEIMAFYKPVEDEAETDAPGPVARCFDMLAPSGYGELVGGSERDTDVKSLIDALEAEGENIVNYDWYLDLRRYGSIQHSGYGVGVERLISWICKLDNIKDSIPFPRTLTRFKP